MANPTLLSRLLCADADKNTIPDTDAGTAGVFSQQYGWQAINSLPLSAGGKAVQRQDFNGVFNLLGGIAFYAQKGYTWEWDSTQDYVVGCVVIDPNDSKRYECISDVTANANPPSSDTTHWKTYGDVDISGKANITLDNLSTFHRDIITTSGTYTAPATALYKITAKGGGGGGGSRYNSSGYYWAGNGGGEGGTTIRYIPLTAGDTVSVVIGAGGSAGADGGDTSFVVNSNTYTAGGGKYSNGGGNAAAGGTGDIIGCAGNVGQLSGSSGIGGEGGVGGGAGGATRSIFAKNGGGGSGENTTGTASPTAGGNGYVWFEYFATTI